MTNGQGGAPHRIDVHHHIIAPRWLEEERDRMFSRAMEFNFVTEWTPEKSLEAMDRNGVKTAVTSISTVTVQPDNPGGMAALARDCNEYAMGLVEKHPGRFGTFALLPLPHVDECLKEIEYSCDTLKVDGFKLQTNYETKWPGDPDFAPVFDELNRRKATVFFHPTVASCCMGLLPGVNPPLMEYPFDTTRAIMSLLVNGTFGRCPDIKFIFSHGGGTIAMLAHRIGHLFQYREDLAEQFPDGIVGAVRRLYFDIVSVTNTPAMSAILNVTSAERLLFGSDVPYMRIEDTVSELLTMAFSEADLKLIDCGNALAMMPSLDR